jgi:hypothetical protein
MCQLTYRRLATWSHRHGDLRCHCGFAKPARADDATLLDTGRVLGEATVTVPAGGSVYLRYGETFKADYFAERYA